MTDRHILELCMDDKTTAKAVVLLSLLCQIVFVIIETIFKQKLFLIIKIGGCTF